MEAHRRNSAWRKPGVAFFILLCLLCALWIAGGASRATVMGQVLARAAAALALVSVLLIGPRPQWHAIKAPGLLLAGSIGIVMLQLVPLPYDLWSILPGRTIQAAIVATDRPWHALTMNTTMTWNALLSLIVPVAVMATMAGLSLREQEMVVPVLISMVMAAALLGLFQFSVGYFDNPLINDTPWQVNGPFANRNHFALFLAIGCLLAPGIINGTRQIVLRSVLALGLTLFFLLMILVTGSRAGLLVGGMAIVIGMAMARHSIRRQLRHAPPWVMPTMVLAVVVVILLPVLASVLAGRAVSIDRLLSGDGQEDMRTRALPVVLMMVRDYFPFGSGFGGFDTVFRIHEPLALLKPTYFNHAHDDFLEIVLDGGLAGLATMLAGLGWWAWAGIRAWRSADEGGNRLRQFGSAILLLVFVASLFDYPARTPLIMAVIVIAAVWLSARPVMQVASALPKENQHL